MTGVTRRGSEAAARPKLRRKSSLILSEKERSCLGRRDRLGRSEAGVERRVLRHKRAEHRVRGERAAAALLTRARGCGRHTSALTSPRACTRRPRAPTRTGAWRPWRSRTSPTSRRASASSPTRLFTRRSRRAHPSRSWPPRAESQSPSQTPHKRAGLHRSSSLCLSCSGKSRRGGDGRRRVNPSHVAARCGCDRARDRETQQERLESRTVTAVPPPPPPPDPRGPSSRSCSRSTPRA